MSLNWSLLVSVQLMFLLANTGMNFTKFFNIAINVPLPHRDSALQSQTKQLSKSDNAKSDNKQLSMENYISDFMQLNFILYGQLETRLSILRFFSNFLVSHFFKFKSFLFVLFPYQNFSRSTLFHMKFRVCLKYFVNNCSLKRCLFMYLFHLFPENAMKF